MKRFQIIEIEWLDSMSVCGWKREIDFPLCSLEEMTHKTVGYFLKENARSIMVIQSFGLGGDGQVNSIMEIPKGSILRKRILK